jgi:Ran GTPase-activating protein (RanGAP) involved in mRNA processing and transport
MLATKKVLATQKALVLAEKLATLYKEETKLDASGQDLYAAGGRSLAEALQGNQVITELNVSHNCLGEDSNELADMSGVAALAGVISHLGALSKLDASGNAMFGWGDKTGVIAWAAALKASTSITELNLAENNINTDDSTILAPAISNNEALSSANLLKNNFAIDQAKAFASILKEHPTLKSLCGNKGDETELDMSGKMSGTEDAIMLVAEIVDNEALTSLNLRKNGLGVEGAKIIAAVLPGCT